MSDHLELIKQHPVFKRLDVEEIENIVNLASAHTLEAEEVVSVEHGAQSNMFLIVSGKVTASMIMGTEDNKVDLLTGMLFGVEAFFQDAEPTSSVTFIANHDTEVLQWDVNALRDYCQENPKTGYILTYGLGQLLYKRLKAFSLNLLNTASWGIE